MAVTYYAITGSSLKTHELMKQAGVPVPASTIRMWKNTHGWWKTVLSEVRRAKQDELDAKLTAVIMKGVDELNDRVENGNYKYNPKTGEIERVPLTSSELAKDAVGIPIDKRAIMRGDPTSRIVKEDVNETLKFLGEQFMKMVELQRQPKPIEGEVISDNEEKSQNSPTQIN